MDNTRVDNPIQEVAEKPSIPIVGIGASAGGLEAFKELLQSLPVDTGMAYVYVQHLDPTHKSLLTDLLTRATSMVVREASENMRIEANHVYVIPPNTDLLLGEGGTLKLTPRTEIRGQHLPIDQFLSSLADNQATLAIGIILSGTASDGTLGIQAIKARGGMTFAQEEISAKYPGMPQSAIATGDVDFIGSPEGIARELTRICRHPYVWQLNAVAEIDDREVPVLQWNTLPEEEQNFQRILSVLRQKTGVDFTAYKPTTLKRRILRRMMLQHLDSTADYLTYLHDYPTEVEDLFQDLLIGVTEFFRHPSIYQELTSVVLPRLATQSPTREPIRVWVPGCSTGEEVYSLAICLLEFFAEQSLTPPIQLFGTDLSASAIERARTGIYAPDALRNVSPERLQRFFLSLNGNYQITKSIRDLCVFAHHNLLKDPPFSRLDLLSCQNVLIYLEPMVQEKLIQIFHYALNPQGVLLLGPAETIGMASDLFTSLGEREQHIYEKKTTSARLPFIGPISKSSAGTCDLPKEKNPMGHEGGVPEVEVQKEVDRLLLARYAPASVVIDGQMEIIHVRGHTSPYLEPAPGRVSFNLFKMAREGLGLELRTLLSKAKRSGCSVKKAEIQMGDNGSLREISVEIIPMKVPSTQRYFLVIFENPSVMKPSPTTSLARDEGQTSRAKRGAKDRRITQLENELAARNEDMRSIIEEMESSSEELQSANEGILSSNEELQSLNEELETSREEIQSTNEELLIVNQELQQRNAQLQAEYTYVEAIVETIREPLLVLDADLRVRSANRAFYQNFQVTAADTEQHLLFELGNGQWNIPALRTLLLEILPTNHSLTDYEVDHTFPCIGRRIMLLNAYRIEPNLLILLVIGDVTERKQMQVENQQLLMQREEFMAIASHELKTPLTSLKAYAQLLHKRFCQAGDEGSASLLAKMNTQLNKLISLVCDLLDVTRIEAGQMAWQNKWFDLDTLVCDIIEEMGHATQQHQIRLEGAVHTSVFGDRERLGQVLTNLLSNAIKYSPQAEVILVKLSADAGAATISVQDFGIGIPSEKLAHVFDRFFRVSDAQYATFPGLGLGLYISEQIIKRWGGRMWVESHPGAGSTFFCTIPLAPYQNPTRNGNGEAR